MTALTTRHADAIRDAVRAPRSNPLEYLRFTRAQWKWINCEHTRAAWVDGNRMGKSWGQAGDIALFATNRHPRQTHRGALNICVASESWAQFVPLQKRLWEILPKDEIDPKLYWAPGQGIKGYKEPVIPIIAGPGKGTVITLLTYQQGALRLAGANFHRAYTDEPPPESFMGELLPRLAQKSGHLRITFTPTPESPPMDWLRDKIDRAEKGLPGGIHRYNFGLKPENVEVIGGLVPLPYMTPEQIQSFIDDCLPMEREMRVNGAWEPISSDRVLINYSPRCEQWTTPQGQLWVGVDHGTAAGKQAFALLVIDNPHNLTPRVWVLDVENPEGSQTPEEDARTILDMLTRNGCRYDDVDGWVGDRSVGKERWDADKSNKDLRMFLAAELKRPVRQTKYIETPKKWSGSVRYGLRLMNAIMRREDKDGGSHFRVHPRCKTLITAIKTFNGDSRHPGKDVLDAVRYPIEAAVRQAGTAWMAGGVNATYS